MAINIPILTSFVDKGVSAAEKSFGGLTKSTLIAGAAIAGAVTAVSAFAYSSIQKASDFNEAISKNTVVFGAISKEVENFAQTANRSLGISETAALQAAGTFAIFGKSAGLAGKDLSDFSIQFVTLAADLASFSNTKVDDAISAIGSALRGEAEPLRKYGVLLNDTTLKAAATELGIYSGNAALTAQQKVLAAQKVIFDQTSDAQGDFGRTSTGLAAQQKILKATLENIQTNLGQAFLPIFLKAVKFFNDEVTPAFERVAEVIGEKGLVKGLQQALFEMGSFGPGMVDAFKQVAVTSAKAANALYKFAVVTAATALFAMGQAGKALGFLGKAFDDLIDVDALGASFDNFAAGIKNMGSASDYSSFAAKKLAEDAKAAADAAKDLPPPGTTDKLKKLEAAVKKASQALTQEMNKALDDAKDKLKTAQNNFDDFSKTVSDGIKDGFSFGKVLSDAAEKSKTLATAVKESNKAIADGLNKTLDKATDQLRNAKTAFTDFAKTVASGIKESFSFKKANEGKDGFITGLRDQVEAIKTYTADVQSLLQRGLSQEALTQILAAGSEAGAAIAHNLLAGAQDDITGPEGVNALVKSVQDTAEQLGMSTAKGFYGQGVDAAQTYFDGIKEQFDQATEAVNAVEAGADVTAGFLEGLTSQITGIQSYADDVSTLLTMGLSQDSLKAVLDAGGESGAAIAKELIKGGANAIIKTNQLVDSAKVAAALIGQQAANQWYGAGVSNAQSYLQGVEAAFAEAQKRLGAKGLKIADVKGIAASFSGALAGPSVTPINMTPEQGGGIPGGGSVVINVNGVLSNAQTGQAVLDSLTQYTQVYGPLNLAIR